MIDDLISIVSRESLAFATEPVFCCLANVLGQHDNIPPSALGTFKDFTLFDVEIKYGLLQVSQYADNVLIILVLAHES